MNWKLNNFNMSILFPVITVNKQNLTIYFKKEFSLVPSTPRANFFPTLLCGVLVFFAAPPRSSSALLPPSSFLLSNYNLSHTTSTRRQHPTHNIPHTTSCIQHHSHNISHNDISHTTHNIAHATSDAKGSDDKTSLREHPTHNVSHTTAHTQHLSQQHLTHNSTHATSLTGAAHLVAGTALCCLPRGRMYALASAGHRRWMCRFQQAQHFVNLHVQISWQAQYFVNLRVQISWQAQRFAACQGVGCTPWRRLGTGAGCAEFVAGAALCEPSCADFVAGAVLCEPPCADLVAGTALCCLPRGRMYALASAGHRRWMCRFRSRRSTL